MTQLVKLSTFAYSQKDIEAGESVPEPELWKLQRPSIRELIISNLKWFYISEQTTSRHLLRFSALYFMDTSLFPFRVGC